MRSSPVPTTWVNALPRTPIRIKTDRRFLVVLAYQCTEPRLWHIGQLGKFMRMHVFLCVSLGHEHRWCHLCWHYCPHWLWQSLGQRVWDHWIRLCPIGRVFSQKYKLLHVCELCATAVHSNTNTVHRGNELFLFFPQSTSIHFTFLRRNDRLLNSMSNGWEQIYCTYFVKMLNMLF